MILSCAEYHEAYWQTNDLAPSENKESTKTFICSFLEIIL